MEEVRFRQLNIDINIYFLNLISNSIYIKNVIVVKSMSSLVIFKYIICARLEQFEIMVNIKQFNNKTSS